MWSLWKDVEVQERTSGLTGQDRGGSKSGSRGCCLQINHRVRVEGCLPNHTQGHGSITVHAGSWTPPDSGTMFSCMLQVQAVWPHKSWNTNILYIFRCGKRRRHGRVLRKPDLLYSQAPDRRHSSPHGKDTRNSRGKKIERREDLGHGLHGSFHRKAGIGSFE